MKPIAVLMAAAAFVGPIIPTAVLGGGEFRKPESLLGRRPDSRSGVPRLCAG